MKQKLAIATWKRKDHFIFFSQFEEPFFGVTALIDCTKAYALSKEKGCSFFLYYLYKSLRVVNQLEAFRCRISNDEVWIYDHIHASPTINRPDGTFGFAYMDYKDDIDVFLAEATLEIERIQNSTGLVPAVTGENVIHYSSMPWIDFTSVSHARSFSFKDSSPKITFGKMTESNGRRIMPVAVHVHHGLMDGWDVGQFFDHFQQEMDLG